MSCPVLLPVSLLQGEDEGLPSPWSMDSSELCEDHGDSLSLFCLDDLEPLCQQCAAECHAGHRVYLLTEAAADCKEELRSSLNGLQKKMVQFEKASQTCEHAAKHNQAEVKLTEELMGREFELLHRFLREEEAVRLRSLRDEQEEKKRDAEERRDTMTQLIKSVEEKIQLMEEELNADGDGVEYLQVTSFIRRDEQVRFLSYIYQSRHKFMRLTLYICFLLSACSGSLESPQVCTPLIDVSSHLGNLQHSVWEKLKGIAAYTPVTFDPRAAGPSLRVSPTFNRVTPGPSQGPGGGLCVSDNPERLHPYSCTLSREGFDSGETCWDIQVGDATRWTVGVAAESVSRETKSEVCPEAGPWCISLRDKKYRALTSPSQDLNLDDTVHLSRVRVRLDWEEGTLEFRNADTDTRLFMFRHRFTEKVYPYFESQSDHVTVEDTEEITSESYPERRYNSVSSAYDNNTKPECRRQHSAVCSVREEKKTKAQRHSMKAKQVKTKEVQRSDEKKESSPPRFRVTYHVSLNKALQIVQSQTHPDHPQS
ncbi:nuclear factor 7, brain-like [Labrus mixtus]|uniref:nuclear factor 7, brain-like n=1 Tax=Labrus mixtus TaxID=508554 RepID=UPI0029C0D731|nr:nuclear factor 7, brain-like [Labrus mixtus]